MRKIRHIRKALLFSLITAMTAACFPAGCASPARSGQYYAELYVSPEGNDSNPGSIDRPLRTLEGARDAVRRIKDSMTSGELIVYFREGIYRMKEPVFFDVRDSARDGCRIIYTAYKDEKPVFSGAEQVTGWEKYDDRLYAAHLERDVKLRNLYVNDHRANMGSVQVEAQGGYGEYSIRAGQAEWAWKSGTKFDGVIYNEGDLPEIESDFDDLEMVNGTIWNENIACARDVIYEDGKAVVLFQQPYGAIAQTPGWGCEFQCTGKHTLYNAFSFVDSPGEFFFDKTGHMLYYYPLEGEDMSAADVEVPYADRLIVIAGNSTEERVRNLTFSGLTFAHTDYLLTEVDGSRGKATVQAALTTNVFADPNWHSEKYEMCDTFPGVINVTNAESINFTDNVIKHTGADGLSMTNDVVGCKVTGNFITDITSSGITIGNPQHVYIGDGDGSNREKFPRGVEGLCTDITVSDNLIYYTGMADGFGGCAGITAFYVDNVRILRNHIEKTAFNGISLGWGWSEFRASSTCRNISACQNRIVDAVYRLHDTGAIYTIGQMPGTVINENYVKGIPAGAKGAPTYGLHNDDGTAWIEEMDNVLDIDKNVTYTINCEEWGVKHHMTIKRTYATVERMGKNPPNCDIDPPIVVEDAVWPQEQYEICVRSGIQDEYRHIMPDGFMQDADYVFPAACETKTGSVIPVRRAGDGKTVWIAPEGTVAFAVSGSTTMCPGTSAEIMTPAEPGEYRVFVTDSEGKVLSVSESILRTVEN